MSHDHWHGGGAQAIDAMQRSFQSIDQATDTIKAKGGIAAKNVRLNTLDSPWKDDDARWFAAKLDTLTPPSTGICRRA